MVWVIGILPNTVIAAYIMAKTANVAKRDYCPAGLICAILGFMWPIILPLGVLGLSSVAVIKRVG